MACTRSPSAHITFHEGKTATVLRSTIDVSVGAIAEVSASKSSANNNRSTLVVNGVAVVKTGQAASTTTNGLYIGDEYRGRFQYLITCANELPTATVDRVFELLRA